MEKPNRFLIYLGAALVILVVVFGIWSLIAKSKFLTIVLVLLAVVMLVSAIVTFLAAFKDKNKS